MAGIDVSFFGAPEFLFNGRIIWIALILKLNIQLIEKPNIFQVQHYHIYISPVSIYKLKYFFIF